MAENKGNIRLWVDALRSGKFEQGNAALTRISAINGVRHESDCCMGVACKVAIENGVSFPVKENDMGTRYLYGADQEDEYLPTEVIEWLGVDNRNVELRVIEEHEDDYYTYDGTFRAAEANDDRGWTFEMIADALEQRYLREPEAYDPHSW